MNFNNDNDMCEKILKQLHSIIKDDPLLEEFSLIPICLGDGDKNVSPVKYETNLHCLGLETWCVKHVYKYAQEQIIRLRKSHKKDSQELLNRCLTGALLIQPDANTFWNIKRELVEANVLSIENEFLFTKLVLSYKCKAYQAFTYRCWLIGHLKSAINYQNLLDSELHVIHLATRNTPNNYHACNHRIWCFEHILPHLPANKQYDELKFTENWISFHVSEHTGFHYRQYVLNSFKSKTLLPNNFISTFSVFEKANNFNVLLSMLDGEYLDKFDDNTLQFYNQFICLLINELFEVLKTLHLNYPGHESIWYHRRYAFYNIYKCLCELYSVTDMQFTKIIDESNLSCDVNFIDTKMNVVRTRQDNRLLAMESSALYKNLLTKEKHFLHFLSDTLNNNYYDCNLSQRYQSWMRCVLGVTL